MLSAATSGGVAAVAGAGDEAGCGAENSSECVVSVGAPALGVAKSILVGRVEGALGEAKGSTAPLVHRGETVGQALRTREGVKPVYVSAGHRMALGDATALAARLAERWKLPQPTHLAHRLSYRGEL